MKVQKRGPAVRRLVVADAVTVARMTRNLLPRRRGGCGWSRLRAPEERRLLVSSTLGACLQCLRCRRTQRRLLEEESVNQLVLGHCRQIPGVYVSPPRARTASVVLFSGPAAQMRYQKCQLEGADSLRPSIFLARRGQPLHGPSSRTRWADWNTEARSARQASEDQCPTDVKAHRG